jgi:hypothetical protein
VGKVRIGKGVGGEDLTGLWGGVRTRVRPCEGVVSQNPDCIRGCYLRNACYRYVVLSWTQGHHGIEGQMQRHSSQLHRIIVLYTFSVSSYMCRWPACMQN